MAEEFVGRAGELASLDHNLQLAGTGQGRTVLIAGQSGIGKTSLVRHWSSVGQVRVLAVSGDADEQSLAGGVLEQLAGQASCPESEVLLELLAAGTSDSLAAGPAVLEMLRAETDREQLLVVVVDDAQWADELSLKAITFALRRLRSAPLLAVIVCRPDAVFDFPKGLLGEIADRGDRLDLHGFTVDEVCGLANLVGAGPLPREDARRLQAHTGGVPLHLRELLSDVPGSAFRAPGSSLPAPKSLAALVLSRLSRCAQETEALVVAVAILGSRCRLSDASLLADLADPLAALEQAVSVGLLVEEETLEGHGCAFTHSLLRTAVYESVGLARRANLHRNAAELSAGSAALLHRVAGSAHPDPGLAGDLEERTPREVAIGKTAEAVDHLLAAVRVGPLGSERDRRLLTAVGLLIDLGHGARARSYAGEVKELPPSGLRDLTLGRLALLNGGHERAEHHLVAAWEAMAAVGSEAERDAAASAACELAQLLLAQHRRDEATRWAERAAQSAVGSLSQACSEVVLGCCLALGGDIGGARSRLRARIVPARTQPDQLLLRTGLGTVEMWGDELEAAAELLAVATSRDNTPGLPLSHLLLGDLFVVVVDYRRGEWDRATVAAERLVGVVEELDQMWLFGRAHAAAVYVHAARGQFEEAAFHAEAAAAHLASGQGANEFLDVTNARAALAFARDDAAGVFDAVAPLAGVLGQLTDVEPGMLSFWPIYAQALVRTGELGDAVEVLGPFEVLAARRERRSAMAAAARVRGCLEAARRHNDAAGAAFARSLGHLAGMNAPYEEALTRLDFGRHLRRSGQRRAAVRELSLARMIFARLGALPHLGQVDSELGTAPRPSPEAGLPLTPRQLSVAEAVADGMTNREIARTLYISIKTVEFHVNQILVRLGADSRAEIAVAISEGRALEASAAW